MSNADFNNSEQEMQETDDSITNCEQENALLASGETVLMQTAKSEVKNPKENVGERTRILFDCGSQRTYISQKLDTKLKLKEGEEERLKVMTFGSNKAKIVKTINTRVDIRLKNGKYFSIVATIVPVISGRLKRSKLDKTSMTHLLQFLKDIILADDLPYENESSEIDLLIGNDYYLDLIMAHRIAVQPGLYLLSSKLGWIVTGRSKDEDEDNDAGEAGMLIMSHTSTHISVESKDIRKEDRNLFLSPDLTDFWNLEAIGITDQMSNTDDEIAIKMFQESLIFDQGRYYVKWPWKEDSPDLPMNRSLAMGRLKSLLNRMKEEKDS